jgi:hypothetical protein
MIRIFLLFLFTTTIVHAQQITSIVRGSVKDADSGLPLVQATVQLDGKGNVTNDAGSFRFEGVEVGRHILTVSFVGYQTLVISEILLESGKENVQEVRLSTSWQTVTGSDRFGQPSACIQQHPSHYPRANAALRGYVSRSCPGSDLLCRCCGGQ